MNQPLVILSVLFSQTFSRRSQVNVTSLHCINQCLVTWFHLGFLFQSRMLMARDAVSGTPPTVQLDYTVFQKMIFDIFSCNWSKHCLTFIIFDTENFAIKISFIFPPHLNSVSTTWQTQKWHLFTQMRFYCFAKPIAAWFFFSCANSQLMFMLQYNSWHLVINSIQYWTVGES